jgi:hypothetical protein
MDNALVSKTYKIPAENLPSLKEHVEKLNKKVVKLQKKGIALPEIDLDVDPKAIVEVRLHTYPNGEQRKREYIYFMVKVTGAVVKVNGWEFIGTLQHEEGGTIIRAVPGATEEGELVQFREAKPVCNHCGYDRKRNDTFILRKTVEA